MFRYESEVFGNIIVVACKTIRKANANSLVNIAKDIDRKNNFGFSFEKVANTYRKDVSLFRKN